MIYLVPIFLALLSAQVLGAGASDSCSPLDSSSPTALNAVRSLLPASLEWSLHTRPLVGRTVSLFHPHLHITLPSFLQGTTSVLSRVALLFLSGGCDRHGLVSPASQETFSWVARISVQTFHLKCKTDSFPPSYLPSHLPSPLPQGL